MAAIELTTADEAKVEEFAGNLFGACLATMELANVELGIRLGLYEALAGAGPVTATELAGHARESRRGHAGNGSNNKRSRESWSSTTPRSPRTSDGSSCRTLTRMPARR